MTTTWLISVIIAFALGFFIRSWFFKNKDQESKLKDEIDKLNAEYTSYRAQVSNHLQKTSQLLEGYKHHQSKLESHLFAATQNFANASLFDAVDDSIDSLPESASDYLSTRGSNFQSNNSPDYINHDDGLDEYSDNDLDSNNAQSHPRDYAAP